MSCKTWKDAIALESGGNLSPAESAALAEHLRDCAACRRYADEMAASQRALQSYHSRRFEERRFDRIRRSVLRRIANDTTPRHSATLKWFPRRTAMRWLALAASLVLAFALWQAWQQPLREYQPREARLPDAGPTPPTIPLAATSTPAPPTVPPAVPEPARMPPSGEIESRRAKLEPTRERVTESLGTTPRPALIELRPTDEPLVPSPWLVVIEPSEPMVVNPPLLILPARSAPASLPGAVLLDLPGQNPTEPVLRRLTERNDYTIYWLEEPADPLEENHDADTYIL